MSAQLDPWDTLTAANLRSVASRMAKALDCMGQEGELVAFLKKRL